MTKLNLGCGEDIRPGYVNVDFRPLHPSVVCADLSKFPWPFETGLFSEILMLDFLEHFPYRQTDQILMECYRLLRPSGDLVVQVPDATHLTRALLQEGEYLCNKCGGEMYEIVTTHAPILKNRATCPKCRQSVDSISDAAMRRLYGGQDYDGNFHYTCFTYHSLEQKLKNFGFELQSWEEKNLQWANWNMKAHSKKTDIW